jgi:hypothetical protein
MPAAQANNKQSPTEVIVIHAGPDDKLLVTDPMAVETTNIVAFKEGSHTEKPPCDQLDASTILSFALGVGVECFVNQYGTPYAQIPVSVPQPHIECLEVRSQLFLSRLLTLLEDKSPATPKLQEIKKAIQMFELQALRSGQRELANRTMVADGVVIACPRSKARRSGSLTVCKGEESQTAW